jgi:radical SAM superfamily enzyme YgiQ (UPF0313 family)
MSNVLICGPFGGDLAVKINYAAPPLGPWRIVCWLRKHGHYAEVYDYNISGSFEEKLKERNWDIIGFSTLQASLPHDVKQANLAHQICPKARIVFGGLEATLNYQDIFDCVPSCEIVCLGEGEKVMLELANGKPAGELKGVVLRSYAEDATSEDFANWWNEFDFSQMNYEAYWNQTRELSGEPEEVTNTVRLVTSSHCNKGCVFCVPGDTMIVTESDDLIAIEDIYNKSINDKVLTHKGNWKPITQRWRRWYKGDLFGIKVEAGPTVWVTPEHPVFVWKPAVGKFVGGLSDLQSKEPHPTLPPNVKVGDEILFADATCNLRKVMKVLRTQHDGWVYNIAVEDDESYFANCIAVHNCSVTRWHAQACGHLTKTVDLSPEQIYQLALKIKQQVSSTKTLYFCEDNFIVSRERAVKAFELLGTIPDLRYLIQTRLDNLDEELIAHLAKNGCRHITVGIENAAPKVQEALGKPLDNSKIPQAIEWCNKHGVKLYCLIILFCPTITVPELWENYKRLSEWIELGATVSIEPHMMCYRGSPLWDSSHEMIYESIPISDSKVKVGKRTHWRFPKRVLPDDPEVRKIQREFERRWPEFLESHKKNNHLFKGHTGALVVSLLGEILREQAERESGW